MKSWSIQWILSIAKGILIESKSAISFLLSVLLECQNHGCI
jgi:hypothetical protein